MLRAHKIELKINNKQATYFAKAAGVARKAYNWGLEQWEKEYKAGGKPNEAALRRELKKISRLKLDPQKWVPWRAYGAILLWNIQLEDKV